MLQQITLGGAMIALPIFLQIKLEYNAMQAGLSLAPLSLSMFAVAILAGQEGREAAPEQHHPDRVPAATSGMVLLIPLVPRADFGRALCDPPGDRRLRARPAGLPAEQLHAGPHRGGAGQRGRGRELRGRVVRPLVRLAMAGGLMLAALSVTFASLTESSTVLPADQQEQSPTCSRTTPR